MHQSSFTVIVWKKKQPAQSSKYLHFVLHSRNKVLQDWDKKRMSKWWHNLHSWEWTIPLSKVNSNLILGQYHKSFFSPFLPTTCLYYNHFSQSNQVQMNQITQKYIITIQHFTSKRLETLQSVTKMDGEQTTVSSKTPTMSSCTCFGH